MTTSDQPSPTALRTTPAGPLGVEVHDVDLREVVADPQQAQGFAAAWRLLLAEHGVAVARGQELDDDQFTALLRSFGELVFTVGETPVEGHPDLNVISNVGRTTPPRSVFHVDTSYVSTPPAYTALRAVTVPEQGGQTLFTDQYAALETLPADLRAAVEGREIRHVVSGVDDSGDQETEAWHPAVRPHPITGRPSLYLSTPQRCVEVSGMSPAEGAELVERLYAHSTETAPTLRHAWAPGDVVMWDNACVLHKADHSGVVGDRVMHRGMVDGYGLS